MTPLVRKLRRVLFLLPYVAEHPEGVPLAELADMLGIKPHVLAKEIAGLATVGLPQGDPGDFLDLYVEGRGATARVYASRRFVRRPPRLTTSEAFALLLGVAILRKTGIESFDDALARAERKVRSVVASGVDNPRVHLAVDTGRGASKVLRELSRASQARRVVELDYASVAGQRRKKVVVEPYGLLNHGGGWYVLGRSLTHAEDRIFVFKVERVLGVTTLDRSFNVPPTFNVRDYVGDRLFIAGLTRVEIKLRLRGGALKRLGGAFKNTRLDRDGSMLAWFRDVPTGSLAAWLLRQGPEVEVLSPESLGRRIRDLARRVADAHAGGPDRAAASESTVPAGA